MASISAARAAHDFIYEQILSGALALGSPISEFDIATKLNISRSPVREALKQLEGEGIVRIFPQRGAFVIEFTLEDINDIFELRVLFETTALKTAYALIGDSLLDDMERKIKSLTEESAFGEYHDASNRLHSVIIEHSRNRHIRSFYLSLDMQMTIVARISSYSTNHFSAAYEGHTAIIDAIRKRDLELADRLLREHLEDARVRTLQAYSRMIR